MRTQTETRRRTGEPGFSSRPPHGLPPLLDASASHPGLMLYTGDCDDALLGRAFRQGGTQPGGPALRQSMTSPSFRTPLAARSDVLALPCAAQLLGISTSGCQQIIQCDANFEVPSRPH